MIALLYVIGFLGMSWLAIAVFRFATEPHFETRSCLWMLPPVIGVWALIAAALLS